MARTRATLWLGLAGIGAGIFPAALLAAGVIRMDVAGAFIVYAAHALWAALLGVAMWRGTARD